MDVRVVGHRVAPLVVGALCLLAGSASPSHTSPSRPTVPMAQAGAGGPELLPQPLEGSALSVLQRGRETWVTVHKPKSVTVLLWGNGPASSVSLPMRTWCEGAGMILALGPVVTVTECNHLWVRGPASWVKERLPMAFIGPADLTAVGTHWWFLGVGAGASGSESVTLWRSQDRGQIWRRVASSGKGLTPKPAGTIPLYGDKSGIGSGPGSQLWLTGSSAISGAAWLFQGPADGRRWSNATVLALAGWGGSQMDSHPPVGQPGLAAYLPVAADGERGVVMAIYRLSPGGRRWRALSVIPDSSALSGPLAVAPAGPRSLFVETPGELYVNRDGGITWSRPFHLPASWTFLGMSFAGTEDGAVLAARAVGAPPVVIAYAVWLTGNGGRTWRSIGVRFKSWTARMGDRSTINPIEVNHDESAL